MDIVDIAVEELQFEYDLIDSFLNDFPEPAMEEGYIETEGHVVDDDNSSSSSNNNTENKSATEKQNSADKATDKKETSNNQSKKNDSKKELADLNKVSKSLIQRAFQEMLDADNAKRDANDKLRFKGEWYIDSNDPTAAHVVAVTSNGKDSKLYEVRLKTSNPDHMPTKTEDFNKKVINKDGEDFIDLNSMDKSELENHISKEVGKDWKFIGIKDNTLAYIHNSKTNEWREFRISVKTNKSIVSPADPKDVKMYNVNKHRTDDDKADFISKLESLFKMIFEMITRAITSIKAKFARAVSGQKTFAKEMEKLQKNKKPNFELKCKNYLYDDNIINKLYTVLSNTYSGITKGLESLFNHFQKVKDDPEGFNNTSAPVITDNGLEYVPLKDAVGKTSDGVNAVITLIGNSIGIKGELGGAGDFYDAVRRMFRGSADIVEFQLKSKPDEFNKAFTFIKNYEHTVNIYLGKLEDTNKNFKKYQTIISRYKNADIPKSEGRTAFNTLLTQCSKSVTFICNCYTFIVSLMQERLLNCRNLIRRAYGKI